jgi:mono/diheme cytochrome c family protein
VTILAVALTGLGALWWLASSPGPMTFAGGKTVALADYQGADPTGVPGEWAGASVIRRGEYLTLAADCQACHTAPGGMPFAGGRALVLPFGTLYSTNITPDGETGIGHYSDTDFLRVIHRGIRPDGGRLYPAMPYSSYTYMTDADALAIKAYLFSLSPVHAPAPPSAMRFPFNQRWLMVFWSLMFNADRRFEPKPDRSAQWNRGAYLAEALAHCGECHTPRNLLQGLDHRQKFAGAVQSGWRAYNVTVDMVSGIGDWSDAELVDYLQTAHAVGRGTASGPMGEAVELSLRHLTPSDAAAIAAYLKTVTAIVTPDLPAIRRQPAPVSYKEGGPAGNRLGQRIFEGACTGCHDWTGIGSVSGYATLTGVRGVNDPTATNVVQVILSGATHSGQLGPVSMPAFGQGYSDLEIAAVANYVTARFGARPSAVIPSDVAKARTLAGPAPVD